MMKSAFMVICIAAVLLSAGCNSSKDGTKETTVTSQVNGEETNANEKTVTTQKSGSGSPQSGGLLDDIKGLFTSRPGQYLIEYKTSITMNNQKDSSGTMAFYYRGADQIRTDMYMDNMESRYYMNKDDVIMCNKQGGEWSCMRIEKGQQQEQDPNKDMDELKNDIETNPVTRLPDRVIIGINCKCFNVKMNINMERAEEMGVSEVDTTYCISPAGVPFYTESRSEGMSSVQEATRYSTSVSDADFIPPAEPKSMMDAMRDMTGGDMGTMPSAEDTGDTGEDPAEEGPSCDMCDQVPESARDQCRKALNCE